MRHLVVDFNNRDEHGRVSIPEAQNIEVLPFKPGEPVMLSDGEGTVQAKLVSVTNSERTAKAWCAEADWDTWKDAKDGSLGDQLEALRGNAGFLLETVKLDIQEEVVALMKEHSMSYSELDHCLGKAPGFTAGFLCGTNKMTLKTLVKVGRALGCTINVGFVPGGFSDNEVRSGR